MQIHTLTIRLSHKLWVALRRMQEDGKVKSIQDAIMQGLDLLTEKARKEGKR